MNSFRQHFVCGLVMALGLVSPADIALAAADSAQEGPRGSGEAVQLAPIEGAVAEQKDEPPVVPVSGGLKWSGRLGVLTGLYDLDSNTKISNGFDPDVRSQFDTDTGYYGGSGAVSLSRGRYTGEVFLEYSDIDSFAVTEAMVRLGRKVYDYVVIVLGYRIAAQGDGFANDDLYKESGFLVAAGIGTFKIPVQVRGRRPTVSVGLGYNGSEIDLDKGTKPNADGYIVSTNLGLEGLPWGLLLRYRRFEYDLTDTKGALRTEQDVTEQYLNATVEYRF